MSRSAQDRQGRGPLTTGRRQKAGPQRPHWCHRRLKTLLLENPAGPVPSRAGSCWEPAALHLHGAGAPPCGPRTATEMPPGQLVPQGREMEGPGERECVRFLLCIIITCQEKTEGLLTTRWVSEEMLETRRFRSKGTILITMETRNQVFDPLGVAFILNFFTGGDRVQSHVSTFSI